MNPAFWPRLGGTFAIGAASLLAGTAAAQLPTPVVPATHSEPAPPPPEIERFHGTVKVGPMTPPTPPAPVLRPPIVEMTLPDPIVQIESRTIAEPAPLPVLPDTRVPDAVVDTLHSVREDTRRVSTAAAVLLGQVGGWLKAPRPEAPRTIVPINVTYPAPAAPITQITPLVVPQPAYYPPVPPWMVPATQYPQLPQFPPAAMTQQVSASAPQQQPTVIVIRDPNPASVAAPAPVLVAPAPTVEPAKGTTTESLLGFGVGMIGLGIGLVGWIRSRKKAEPAAAAVPTSTPATPPDGVLLAGGLYAGPRPEFAEKFDLGPTYEDEQLAKKRLEEENQNAVLEFILSQNIALQAELAGPTTDEEPASARIEVLATEG